jgi:cytochrome c553
MRKLSPYLVAAISLLAAPSHAADAKAGRALAAQKCQVCHGIDGIAKMPVAPTQLKSFRSGKRENEMMTVVAKDLSGQDIANLAAWYASIEISVKVPE